MCVSKLIPYTRMHELCFEDMEQTPRMLMFPHFCLKDGKVGLMCGIGLRCFPHICGFHVMNLCTMACGMLDLFLELGFGCL